MTLLILKGNWIIWWNFSTVSVWQFIWGDSCPAGAVLDCSTHSGPAHPLGTISVCSNFKFPAFQEKVDFGSSKYKSEFCRLPISAKKS